MVEIISCEHLINQSEAQKKNKGFTWKFVEIKSNLVINIFTKQHIFILCFLISLVKFWKNNINQTSIQFQGVIFDLLLYRFYYDLMNRFIKH